jgi:ribosomal protein S18 acetylase RimI-like enzyme
MALRIIDVVDEAGFRLIPPCADPGFDHRSCDYWEDADRGSRAARASWLETVPPATMTTPTPTARPPNPFVPDADSVPAFNPFAAESSEPVDNPFAPRRAATARAPSGWPRKLSLLVRGLTVFGSYAKVVLDDDVPVAFAQFGPLSAYPRASRLREMYPQLPAAPLPAVITCIATTAEARNGGLAKALVDAVCDDLGRRGFAAVETYPEIGARPDATSAATPGFWESVGFRVAAADDRFPVMRRELS